jgi:serine-type D-Ala-D-Ala carboxypeptidase/endopeptidase
VRDRNTASPFAAVAAVGCASVFWGGLLLSFAWSPRAYGQEAERVPPERAWTVPSNEKIRDLLAERMKNNGVGIVVGVIEPAGRRVVAYGRSGAGDARPLDGDAVFQIGSVTKVFTALVLADMVQRGEVKLDDPASKYLPPGVKMPERGRPITLVDLATHMSGLPSMPTNYELQGELDPYEAYSVQQLHEFLGGHRLEREPGAKWQYSNLGVALLGRLLARRAEVEYEELVKGRVLKPLGMNSTAITLTPDQSKRLIPGHDRYLKPVRTWEMRTLPASGALRSTANDMLTFLAANLGSQDTPLRDAMVYQRSVRVPSGGGGAQALGWSIRRNGDDEIVSHEGGKQGYRSGVAFSPKSGTGVVILANARTDDRPGAIAMHLLTGSPLGRAPSAPPERRRVTLDRNLLETYAGRYRLEVGTILTVARKDGHLLVETTGNGVSEFFAEGARDFFLDTGNDEITFQMDANGRVTGLALYGDGKGTGEHQIAPRINGSAP